MNYRDIVFNNHSKNENVSGSNRNFSCWSINYKTINEIEDYRPCIILTSYPLPSNDSKHLIRKYNSVGYYETYEEFLAIEALKNCTDIYFIEVLENWNTNDIDEIIEELRLIHTI